MNLLSHAQTAKFLGVQPYFEVMHSQFHGAKFLGIQHMSVKCSYYSLFILFLGVHIKGSQKYLISQFKMRSQEEPLSDTDTSTSTDLELVALYKLQCSLHHLQLHGCKLIPQNKGDYKSPDVQRGTVTDTALFNSTPFAEQCYHIIQYLCSPEIDGYYPDNLNDKHSRQNFKRKADRYKWDETRQKLFYPNADQF